MTQDLHRSNHLAVMTDPQGTRLLKTSVTSKLSLEISLQFRTELFGTDYYFSAAITGSLDLI